MFMERLKINQVAQELGVTPAGVYKRLKSILLKNETQLSLPGKVLKFSEA